MAKAAKVAYRVIGNQPLHYNGKTANVGDVVIDIPGESISWLLTHKHIESAPLPVELIEVSPAIETERGSAETAEHVGAPSA